MRFASASLLALSACCSSWAKPSCSFISLTAESNVEVSAGTRLPHGSEP